MASKFSRFFRGTRISSKFVSEPVNYFLRGRAASLKPGEPCNQSIITCKLRSLRSSVERSQTMASWARSTNHKPQNTFRKDLPAVAYSRIRFIFLSGPTIFQLGNLTPRAHASPIQSTALQKHALHRLSTVAFALRNSVAS